MPWKGLLGNFVVAPSDRCPAIANLLSLNASHVILTRVLRFEVFGTRRRTQVRLVHPTGQTAHWSDRLMLMHLRLRS
jgi:hypothetical protein